MDIHQFPGRREPGAGPRWLPARTVILCRSLDHPNAKLIELGLAAAAARGVGATDLTLVAPYLCYMRQDKAFRPR